MENYIGELRIFASGAIPRGWVACNGQLMSIQQNTALFSLLGTSFGGNGVNTFSLPDLRGRTSLGMDSNYPIGQAAGTESVSLLITAMPVHSHLLNAKNLNATARLNATAPAKALALPVDPANTNVTVNAYAASGAPQTINPGTIGMTGGNSPHENRMPLLTVNICIATSGVFPSRN